MKAMVLSFLTSPYNNYYAANSEEFISLDKAAKQDFHLESCYNLLLGNANSFADNLKTFQSNLAMDSFSTSRPHVKLTQQM
jgi:hypothetical protein